MVLQDSPEHFSASMAVMEFLYQIVAAVASVIAKTKRKRTIKPNIFRPVCFLRLIILLRYINFLLELLYICSFYEILQDNRRRFGIDFAGRPVGARNIIAKTRFRHDRSE